MPRQVANALYETYESILFRAAAIRIGFKPISNAHQARTRILGIDKKVLAYYVVG